MNDTSEKGGVRIVWRSGDYYTLKENEGIRWSNYSLAVFNKEKERHYPYNLVAYVEYVNGRKVVVVPEG